MEASGQLPTNAPAASSAPAEVRQRWRLTYRRRDNAPALAQREQVEAWDAALIASGLPLAGLDLPTPRPRLVFGAPLTTAMPAEAELVDLFLVERRPVADVRERLVASLPAGHELVDAYDVWLGEPPLSGRVVAADYRLRIGLATAGGGTPGLLAAGDVDRGARDLLAARALPRTRDKGGRTIAYDLRPLLVAIDVLDVGSATGEGAGGVAGSPAVRIRTRFDPERGVGRPEEVVAALGETLGLELEARSIVRERLILSGDRAAGSRKAAAR